jgi:hypothetical protein
MLDVSSLLQRIRLHEGHIISSAALARSLDKVHDGAARRSSLINVKS